MDPERLALIPTRLQEFVEEGQIAGAVMVLARHDGIVLLEAVGYQNLETKTPMRTDAIFRMASVAKPVTALGIMVLQEDGRLSSRDRVGQHLPDFRNLQTDPASERPQRVTIEQLMTHTSGMASENDLYESDFMQRSLADVVATYTSKPLASSPGTNFLYSSPGFDVLGRVIEVVSGTYYEAFMADRVFGPLGMEDSGFFPAMWEHRDRIAPFYQIEDDRLQEAPRPVSEEWTFPSPAFGLFSTATDMGALLQMLLSSGTYDGRRILSRASVTAMTVDRIRADTRTAWGWAAWVGRAHGGPLASSRTYGMRGSSGVSVWVDPENDLAGAFLIHQINRGSASAVEAFMAMAAAAVVDR
jgi:CubicO group peptidase (beta-lactamase class C family)